MNSSLLPSSCSRTTFVMRTEWKCSNLLQDKFYYMTQRKILQRKIRELFVLKQRKWNKGNSLGGHTYYFKYGRSLCIDKMGVISALQQFSQILLLFIMRYTYPLLFLIFALALSQSTLPYFTIANSYILKDNSDARIYIDGQLNDDYNDETFNQVLSCRNGNLNIIDWQNQSALVVEYNNMRTLTKADISVSSSPNPQPLPFVKDANETHFLIEFNCTCGQQTDCADDNYFNKVKVDIDAYSFSFLVHCDPNRRHKKFQIGYLLIALINSAIIIGVAMHSHVWSIRINNRPLRYVLFWKPFLIFSVVGIGILFSLYFLTFKDFSKATVIIRYFGVVISIFFVFLCFNEILFLVNKLKKSAYKSIRYCDIGSGLLTIGTTVFALLSDNWILYDMIAVCICVGSIKIFHFDSLKESYLAMTIMVATITIISVALHYLLPQSYNDYAGELSSPVFLEVPDLVNNLFKKCSWLPIFDVIIPGVTLSFLRVHDQNKSSKFGGIYTLSGNITFIVSTIIWISIELFDPYSFPFSLVTCPLLMLVIFIISWRRNQWFTLLYGRFQQGYDVVDDSVLKQTRSSFSKLVSEDALSDILIKQEIGSSIITN